MVRDIGGGVCVCVFKSAQINLMDSSKHYFTRIYTYTLAVVGIFRRCYILQTALAHDSQAD